MAGPASRQLRGKVIAAGFGLIGATGLHRLVAPATRGLGAILMFHHVRAPTRTPVTINRGLEITPEFLDTVIETLRARGFEIVDPDAALARMAARDPDAAPFAVLTFDDGYRNIYENAVPVLRRHGAPYTLYIATGFADGVARMWWEELEAAVNILPMVRLDLPDGPFEAATASREDKVAAAAALYWRLRGLPEPDLRAAVARLAEVAGLDGPGLTRSLCMGWGEIVELADDPLCTIGVHTLTHPRLALTPEAEAFAELAESRAIIEARIGQAARHLAYPVGDPGSAGPREFALAEKLGFASAVTTRPGMIFPEHAAHALALPRLSVNGQWQQKRSLDVLLSGLPFVLWNRGRRLNVG